MSRLQYRDWDYTAQTVTTYKRLGECLQCGECCRWVVRFQGVEPFRKRDLHYGSAGTDGEGVWSEVQLGRWRYYWRLTKVSPREADEALCGALSPEGLCTRHGSEEHSPVHICTVWPFSPLCLEQFPNCGFSFEVESVEEFPKEDNV